MVGSVVGSNKSSQKETTLAEPRQVEASSGGQEGCNDRVRMVNVPPKVAKFDDENRGTSRRVINVLKKTAAATETF